MLAQLLHKNLSIHMKNEYHYIDLLVDQPPFRHPFAVHGLFSLTGHCGISRHMVTKHTHKQLLPHQLYTFENICITYMAACLRLTPITFHYILKSVFLFWDLQKWSWKLQLNSASCQHNLSQVLLFGTCILNTNIFYEIFCMK